MCFSASASFAASGGLGVIGVATLNAADKKQRALAILPLLFAVQQMFEGLQWLSLASGTANKFFGYAFLFFALLFWPIYVPVMVFLLDQLRRPFLRWFIFIGVAISLFLLSVLFLQPLTIEIRNSCIYYQINTPFGIIGVLVYLAVVCGSLFISSKPFLRWFGCIALASAMITAFFFFETFTSVWCFFAALLSTLIYVYIISQKRTRKKAAR